MNRIEHLIEKKAVGDYVVLINKNIRHNVCIGIVEEVIPGGYKIIVYGKHPDGRKYSFIPSPYHWELV